MMMPEAEWLLIAQAAATLYMTGLIWFVQVVHYPLLARVGDDAFPRYEQEHTRLTSWVVGPPMLIEMATALLLILQLPSAVSAWQAWTGLGLVGAIWVSTATLQVPQHRRLSLGFEPSAHRKLVVTNWIRAAGWSLRSALVLYWIAIT